MAGHLAMKMSILMVFRQYTNPTSVANVFFSNDSNNNDFYLYY